MSEWISVKDGLPPSAGYEKCKRYAIWTGIEQFAFWYNDEWTSDCIGPYSIYHPTHWTYMREPPS